LEERDRRVRFCRRVRSDRSSLNTRSAVRRRGRGLPGDDRGHDRRRSHRRSTGRRTRASRPGNAPGTLEPRRRPRDDTAQTAAHLAAVPISAGFMACTASARGPGPPCVDDRAVRCEHFPSGLTTLGLHFYDPPSLRRAPFIGVGASLGKQRFHFTVNCRALRFRRAGGCGYTGARCHPSARRLSGHRQARKAQLAQSLSAIARPP